MDAKGYSGKDRHRRHNDVQHNNSGKGQPGEFVKIGSGEGAKKCEPTFPNYLIAMQLTNPKIFAGVWQLQKDVVSNNERLEPSLQPIGLLHITMFMMRLNTDEEVKRAKLALDQCKKEVGRLYKDRLLSVDIAGMGNFRDKVVFAKVKNDEQETKLREVADIIEECFRNHSIVSAATHEGFSAHVTVLNLSKDKNSRRKGGMKRIDPAVYKKYMDTDFGQQHFNSLQLCPMMKPKLASGYYDVEYTVQFGPDIKSSTDKLVGHTSITSETDPGFNQQTSTSSKTDHDLVPQSITSETDPGFNQQTSTSSKTHHDLFPHSISCETDSGLTQHNLTPHTSAGCESDHGLTRSTSINSETDPEFEYNSKFLWS